MKTMKALKSREAELKAAGKKLLDAADAAGRDLTADEERDFQAIETELATLAGDIAAAERAADRRRRMEGAAVPVTGGSAGIQVGADRATLDPRAGFAGGIGEFAQAVRRANPQTPNGAVDPRLAAMYQAAPTGYMREGASNDGYMVPPEFRDRIWEQVFAGDNLLSEVDSEQTSSNQVNDHYDDWTPWGGSGVQATWRTEASQMTPTRPDTKPRSVILHELYAFVTATDELLEDAPRLNSRIDAKAAAAIGWKIDEALMYGNGVGKPFGWMASGALVTVAKETGQAAASLVPKNIAKMYGRMLGDSIARSHWRVNSDVMPELMTMTLDGNLIWTPPSSGLVNAPGGLLLGRPIRFSEHCKTLGTVGDVQLVDPKGYYALTKAGGVKFASSIHLYFDYGLQAFRWTVRLGGQPHLAAPVSPANGSTTKSHFVALATRS